MTIQTTQASEATQAVASLAEAAVAASQEMQQGATVTMALNRYLERGQLAQPGPGILLPQCPSDGAESALCPPERGFSLANSRGRRCPGVCRTAPDSCSVQSQSFLHRPLVLGFFFPNLSEVEAEGAAVLEGALLGFWLHSDLRCSSTGPPSRTKYFCSALLSCLNLSRCS